jgi:hypothetical protein
VHSAHSTSNPSSLETVGSFKEVSLPGRLIEDWRANILSLSNRKREEEGGLLVAGSVLEGSGGHSVLNTFNALDNSAINRGASGSAGKGYLAVIVAGGSQGRGLRCLWLYNILTRRWRSTALDHANGYRVMSKALPLSSSSKSRASSDGDSTYRNMDIESTLGSPTKVPQSPSSSRVLVTSTLALSWYYLSLSLTLTLSLLGLVLGLRLS